jgi:hypothetical protein
MSDNNSKFSLDSKFTIVATILIIFGTTFFTLTYNARENVTLLLKKFDLRDKTQYITKSSTTQNTEKYVPEFIDKADILLKKSGEITWDDIVEISPEEQQSIYSGFTQEQKDKLVKTWNDLKTTTNGDPTKARS